MTRILSQREINAFLQRVRAGLISLSEIEAMLTRFEARLRARGPSKLARRLRRKQQLGRAGAF